MVSQEVARCDRGQLGISLDQSRTLCPLPYSRCTDEDDSGRLAELLGHVLGAHRWLIEGTEVRRKLLLLVLKGTVVRASVLAIHARHHDHGIKDRQQGHTRSKQTGHGSVQLARYLLRLIQSFLEEASSWFSKPTQLGLRGSSR